MKVHKESGQCGGRTYPDNPAVGMTKQKERE